MAGRPSFLSPILDAPSTAFALVNERTGLVVAGRALGAFDSASRNKGLLGQTSMAPNSALIIAPTNAIHTWFMKFAIDVAFVDQAGRVVKIRRRMGAWRIAVAWRAFAVIELAASGLDGSGTEVGDRLVLRPG